MAIESKAIADLVNAITSDVEDKRSSTYSAIVSRVDNEGVIWVKVAGSDKETPTAATSAEVKANDSVNVEWRNNKLYIAGNVSNPAAGTIRVRAVEQAAQVANQAAQNAVDDAGRAREAANNATNEAVKAKNTADRVEDIAEGAQQTANSVKGIAEDAQKSAGVANHAASSAQNSLGDIEKVVDVLNWIAEHGEYAPTTDTEAKPGKFYFDSNNNQVTPVVNPSLQEYYELATETWMPTIDTEVDFEKTYFERHAEGDIYYTIVENDGDENPSEEGWYELSNDTYSLTSDTSVIDNKLYFESADQKAVITEYIANPAILGLYELTDVKDSISNYVASHVSLDGEGLVIQTDNIESKVRISGNGVELINNRGDTIATFSGDITLGDTEGIHVKLSPANGLEFWNNKTRVAYVNSNTLQITNAEIKNTLRIGKFRWKVKGDNRISFVYEP